MREEQDIQELIDEVCEEEKDKELEDYEDILEDYEDILEDNEE